MKIRIVKVDGFNPYIAKDSTYYKLQFLRRFLFWTYWSEPEKLNFNGCYNENNFFSRIEEANKTAEQIIKSLLPFTETVVKEISSEI